MPEEINPVAGETGVVGSEGTPNTGSVTQGVTPTQSADDVEKKILELTQKAERDVAALKSTFQKSEAELKKQMEAQKRDYDVRIKELALAKMDETERKEYEAKELTERNKNYELEAQQLKQALAERDQKDQWKDYFIAQGIPVSDLTLDGDLSTLVNSGHQALAKMTAALKKKIDEIEKKNSKTDTDAEVTPPEVSTSTVKSSGKLSWSDLVKRFGSAENVYRAVELGQLPSSVIPLE